MAILTRRSVLGSSLALGAVGTLARPYLANAAATTADVWWVQGFIPEEDVAFKKVDRKSTRLNSSHIQKSRMPSSA